MANIKFTAVTNAARAAGTPADGEYVWTTDTKVFYRGDGSTVGGVLIGPAAGATVHDTPVDGATTTAVSSNWAHDHAALATAHGITAAAATVLDDATVAAMVDTLGGATSTGSGGLVRATSPALVTPTLGTPASGTLTNCTGLPVAGIAASTSAAIGVGSVELGHASDTTLSRASAGVVSVEGVPLARRIASGTATLGTTAIASGESATVVTVSATGVATTDVVDWGFNQSPNGVTGYNAASTTGCLVITAYPTADNVNFLVSNPTADSITPGALTLNWKVVR
jgi:hypothetical protein